jgi:hypothetical protein
LDEPYDDPRRLQAMALEDLERTSDAFEMPPSDPDTPTATALPTALRNLRRYRLKSPKSASSELAQGLADIASTGQPGARLYAALGLRDIDAKAGRSRLIELATDDTPLGEMGHFGERYTTVAKVARQALDTKDVEGLPPPPPDPQRPLGTRIQAQFDRLLDWFCEKF